MADSITAKLAFVVVDDDEDRDEYVQALERVGFKVKVFSEEAPALAALPEKSPHIVVTHFAENMARTVEFINELHARDETICIIYFTYYGGRTLHARAVAAGAFAVQEKPYPLYNESFIGLLRNAYEESWKRKRIAAGKHRALVLMPFKDEFVEVYHVGVKDPLEELGYVCERIDDIAFVGDVVQKLLDDKLENAGLIIADMTSLNPNVFYELGYADALKKTVILLTQTAKNVPFDVRARRFITYTDDLLQLRQNLIETVRSLEDDSEV